MAATFKPILFGEAVVLVIRRVSFEVARFDVCRAKGPIIYLAPGRWPGLGKLPGLRP